MPMVARLALTAAPVPELEPHGLRDRTYGFFVWPPRPLHPDVERVERKFAHSERFVLPSNTAPASRSFATMKASCFAWLPTRARDPAVVIILSAVSMLSLMTIGIPCSGPRNLPAARSLSRSRAIASASGLSSMIELRLMPPSFCASAAVGLPRPSISAIRSRYIWVICSEVRSPAAIFSWRSRTVASSTRNGSWAKRGRAKRRASATRSGRLMRTL